MTQRIHPVLLTICLLALPGVSAAQANPGDITFTIPVNLTQLANGLGKVRVGCEIQSDAITVNRQPTKAQGPGSGPGVVYAKSQEIPISGGQVTTTATVVVSTAGVLNDPIGKSAAYLCALEGFSNAQQRWMPFNYSIPISGTEPALRLTPNPGSQSGSFTW
jgi:hypothetical protein